MVTWAQAKAGGALHREGLITVGLPHTDKTPIPGLILYTDEGHRHLWKLLPDGRVVDLLAVFDAAEDCVRNWHKPRDGGKSTDMPHFVGDFGRLTKLAEALNGRKPEGE